MCEDLIIIKFKGQIRKIIPNEITFIENELRKVLFYMPSEVCGTYGKIETYMERLPKEFYRCNKSYVINLNKVVKMNAQVIYFSDGNKLNLGKKSFYGARKAFLEFALPLEKK